MAKTRGGLGRGLGSLLGDIPEGIVKQEPSTTPPAPIEKEEAASEPVEEKIPAPEPEPAEDDYPIAEENVTIKGVVERVVAPPTTLVVEEENETVEEVPE